MPLSAAHPLALQQLPEGPGYFRLRFEGEAEAFRVEPAERGVREMVERLARQVRLPEAPAASGGLALELWRVHRQDGRGYQVSGARTQEPKH